MEYSGLRHVSSSPHIRSERTVPGVMLEVIVALVPAGAFGVYYFGWRALLVILVSVLSAVVWEWLYCRVAKKSCTVGDLSCVVTGILLAYNLPSTVPVWMPVIGTLLAIVLVKMLFGGPLGANFVNPALCARAILMTSWVGYMSGTAYETAVRGMDAIASATPLAAKAQGSGYALYELFIGQCPGCIGEVGRIALLVGRRLSDDPAGDLLAHSGDDDPHGAGRHVDRHRLPLRRLLRDSLRRPVPGRVFMATDYATSPVTPVGRLIMGVGCGVIAFVIRRFSSMPEGVSYAILIMNLAVPLIDRFTKPRVYGEVKRHA